jgi:hypothetical protein
MFELVSRVRGLFGAVGGDRLGEQLFASGLKPVEVDMDDDGRSESPSARIILDVIVVVAAADDHALARLGDLFAPVFRSVLFDPAGDERFQRRGLGLRERRQFRDFDHPFAPQVHRQADRIAVDRRQAVGEIFVARERSAELAF